MSASLQGLFHPPVPGGLRKLEASLLQVEQSVNLLGRFRPLNYQNERARVEASLARAERSLPRFEYERAPALSQSGDVLAAAQLALCRPTEEAWEPLRQLLIARVEELSLELRLVRERGRRSIPGLSAERFFYDTAELNAAEEEAFRWLRLPAESPSTDGPPRSLVPLASFLSRESSRRDLDVRVLETELASSAAVSDGCLLVRRGLRVQENEARRIFEHEIYGHYLPRQRAKGGVPPLSVGSAGSSEDEEGRAIVLEERAGLLSVQRRHQLAIRFLLASAARKSEEDAVVRALELRADGACTQQLAHALCRALRGGGLGREVVYLASYLRVREAQRREPQLEELMSRGRLSVRAAPVFQSFSNSITTGV